MLFKKLIDFVDRIKFMLTFKIGSTGRLSEILQRGRGGQEQEAYTCWNSRALKSLSRARHATQRKTYTSDILRLLG